MVTTVSSRGSHGLKRVATRLVEHGPIDRNLGIQHLGHHPSLRRRIFSDPAQEKQIHRWISRNDRGGITNATSQSRARAAVGLRRCAKHDHEGTLAYVGSDFHSTG
jgi:hypothetical protein